MILTLSLSLPPVEQSNRVAVIDIYLSFRVIFLNEVLKISEHMTAFRNE